VKSTKLTLIGAIALLIVASATPALGARPAKADLSVPDGYYGTTVTATDASATSETLAASSDSDEWKYWRVKTECYQNGEIVMRHYSLWDGSSATIPLGPTRAWQEGDAECTAELGYFHKGVHTRWRVVDSTDFIAMWPDAEVTTEAFGGSLVSVD